MTPDRSRRINARLPPDVARKVAYLERRTNQSTTAVVLEAVERYYAAMKDGDSTPADILEQTGFVGSAEGPSDLSTSYKALLTKSLSDKT